MDAGRWCVGRRSASAPGSAALLGFRGGTGSLSTFLVRLVQPFGRDVLNFQLLLLPAIHRGFHRGRRRRKHGWLEALVTTRRVRVAGWLGCFGGPLLMTAMLGLGGPPPENGPNLYAGGWNFRALAFATWEQLTGLGIALGLMAWFHQQCHFSGRVRRGSPSGLLRFTCCMPGAGWR